MFSCLTHAEVVRRADPDLNRRALEKFMEPEFHRIERPLSCIFAEAGQGRKLAW